MNYKYNQLIFKKIYHGKVLIKFLFYRPDKNTVVYDYDGTIGEIDYDLIIPAEYKSIYDFFEIKIDKLKEDIRYQKNCILVNKKQSSLKLYIVQDCNKKIKELTIQIFNNKIMNTVTNSNMCDNDMKELMEKRNEFQKQKKFQLDEYNYYLLKKKQNKVEIKNLKEKILQIKLERNDILKNGIYIQKLEEYNIKQMQKDLIKYFKNN